MLVLSERFTEVWTTLFCFGIICAVQGHGVLERKNMEAEKKKLKVYCETSFWSFLNGGRTPLSHIAVKQAATLLWWEEIAPSCDIYVSQYVEDEACVGKAEFVDKRIESMASAYRLDARVSEVDELSRLLMAGHAVPETEATDALHIATAAVYGMDVLLTWNCRHMANLATLPRTLSIVVKAGYQCPVIITPDDFLARKEDFGL